MAFLRAGGATLLPPVILSAAKDLMPVASGDEVLRCAQDDWLSKRRLVEAAELARMQRTQFAAQQAQRLQADAQVLADRPPIEARGRAGQLDLAMQRLVGDAEQGAVRHAQPIALRRQGGAFHVDRDGAPMIDAPPFLPP